MAAWRRLVVGAGVALSLVAMSVSSAAAGEGGSVINFHSMTPITGAAVGSTERGLKAGGLPWAITSGRGEVNQTGVVEVRVTGLVLTATGANPIGTFAATVSCVTRSGIVNVQTKGFPATMTGDSQINTAQIEDRISLPSDCMQPEVFVGGLIRTPTGAVVFRWFAVSNA